MWKYFLQNLFLQNLWKYPIFSLNRLNIEKSHTCQMTWSFLIKSKFKNPNSPNWHIKWKLSYNSPSQWMLLLSERIVIKTFLWLSQESYQKCSVMYPKVSCSLLISCLLGRFCTHQSDWKLDNDLAKYLPFGPLFAMSFVISK